MPPMKITVVYAPDALQVREWLIELPDDGKLRLALTQCGAFEEFPDLAEGLACGELTVGIWGRAARADQLLADNDRIEIYRPLRVDPKVARRERFKGQGSRGAGLFAKRREGGKAGY